MVDPGSAVDDIVSITTKERVVVGLPANTSLPPSPGQE
jgi:hypothetical protein